VDLTEVRDLLGPLEAQELPLVLVLVVHLLGPVAICMDMADAAGVAFLC